MRDGDGADLTIPPIRFAQARGAGAETVRASARRTTADLLRAAAAARHAEGRPGEAAELLRRILAIDRSDDAAHELLVSCLLDAGDVAPAKEAHEARLRAMAELDIDVAPFRAG